MKPNLVGRALLGRLLLGAGCVGAIASLSHTVVAESKRDDKTASQIVSIGAVETDGETVLRVRGTSTLTFTTFKLEQPPRVVLDVSGARLGEVEVPFDAGTFAVGAVSASTSQDGTGVRTRVLIALRRPSDYRVETGRNELRIHVKSHAPLPVSKAVAVAPGPDKAAEARIAAETKKLAEGQARLAANSLAEIDRLARERADLEHRRAEARDAQRGAEEAMMRLADERKNADRGRALAAEAQSLAKIEEKRSDEALKAAAASEAAVLARLRRTSEQDLAAVRAQVAAAHEETEKARASTLKAKAETARLVAERKDLDTQRSEIETRRQALLRSEGQNRVAAKQLEEERKAAASVEGRAAVARQQEEKRRESVNVAAAAVETQSRLLAQTAAVQAVQEAKLKQANLLVAERELRLKQAELSLIEQQKIAAAAEARVVAMGEKTTQAQRQAALEAAEAAGAARAKAAAESERIRNGLQEAIIARKQEDEARNRVEAARKLEEQRLATAVKAREDEEARRSRAEASRIDAEGRLQAVQTGKIRMEAETTRLASEKAALAAEVLALRKSRADALAKAPPVPPTPIPARIPAPVASTPTKAPEIAVPFLTVAAAPIQFRTRPQSVTIRAKSHVRRIDFIDEPTRSSVVIDLDEPSRFQIESWSGHLVTLRLLHTELGRDLQRSLDATEFLGPVRLISSYKDPNDQGTVRVDVELADEVPNRIRQEGSRIFWDFTKPAVNQRASDGTLRARWSGTSRVAAFSTAPLFAVLAQQAGSPASSAMPRMPGSKKRFVGRRIDLDFKGADIHNILRLLSDVGEVNIVTSDDVKGEVTIKMKDVPWDQALDVVLRSKGLGQVREGNLLRVAPLAVLEKELEQEISRQKQITDVLPTETRLIGVSYAEASSISERAKDLLSTRGKISVDARTNTLIISDVARNLSLIEELIRNLDTQTSQVVIEARIVEARSTFVRQMGIQWGGTGFADAAHGNPTGLAFPSNLGIGGGATDGQTPTEGLVAAPRNGYGSANPNFAVNLPVAAGVGSGAAVGLTLGSVAGAFNLNLRLSALESTGQVRILSSPRVQTLDNSEASIEQGVSIPVSVVSAAGAQTIFVDAKLNLTVRPHVTNEGTVLMKVNVTRNEPDFVNTGARGDPTILKKEAKTDMLVRDGDTAVIGGIYQRNSGLNYTKIPFFADLPVLGVLFRNRRENDDRTEFLVFITPRIANRARSIGN